MDSTWLVVMGLAAVVGIPASVYYNLSLVRRRVEAERGKTPHLEELCGGRFGGHRFFWPFVRYAIYSDFIVILFARTRIVLTLDKIVDARLTAGSPPAGVAISHGRKDTPSVELRTKRAAEVVALLERRGVRIVPS